MVVSTDKASRSSTGPKAMTRVLALLWWLSDKREGASLSEAAVELGVPKSTLRDSLPALVAEDYLVMSEGRFRLGPRAFRLGAHMTSNWSTVINARSYMVELASMTGESVALTQLDRDAHRFMFIDVVESRHRLRFATYPGRSGPLYLSASGRVMLAYLESAYVDAYLAEAPFPVHTPLTLSTECDLRRAIAKAREEQVAVMLGEVELEGGAISAPLFGPHGDLVGTLALTGPVSRLEPRLDELKRAVVAAARAASGLPHDAIDHDLFAGHPDLRA